MIDFNRMNEIFELFNSALKDEEIEFEIYLFGSGLGMYYLKEEYRYSYDFDFMSKDDIKSKPVLNLMHQLGISDMGGIMMVPELEDIIITKTLSFSNLIVHIPSIENFALSKLLSDRGKDYYDLEKYPILDNCDLKKLRDILEENLDYYVFKDNPRHNFHRFDELLEIRGLK